ncbi:hypothetical protein GTY49_20460 [Streptomyces sp. SID5477]|nr:hypothetical protein [Streptomyces sp. SID5477]
MAEERRRLRAAMGSVSEPWRRGLARGVPRTVTPPPARGKASHGLSRGAFPPRRAVTALRTACRHPPPTASRRRRITPAGDVRLVPHGERVVRGWETGMVDVRSAAS